MAEPDLIVVVAFGQILKPALLAIPRLGCVNLHASLLPRYRGAAPISWAIARGETLTGVTTLFVNERVDAGDVIFQEPVPIGPDDTGGSLHDRLAAAGAALLARTVEAVAAGNAPRRPQNDAEATYAPKIRKTDARVDWSLAAEEIRNRVRAFNPWPVCYCEAPKGSGRILRLWRVQVEPRADARPGVVLRADGAPLVGTGAGALRLLEVQPEGRRVMSGEAFRLGYALREGDLLG